MGEVVASTVTDFYPGSGKFQTEILAMEV